MAANGEKKKKSHNQNPSKPLAPKPQKPFKKSSKDKKKSQDPSSIDPRPTSLLVQDDGPEFPRGGGGVLSRKEAADAEFEREEREFRKGKDRRKKKNDRKTAVNDGDDELGSLFGDGVTGRLPRFANRITLKVDDERRRILLGMKKSYVGDVSDVHNFACHTDNDEDFDDSEAMDDSLVTVQQNDRSPSTDDAPPILSLAESRASVLALQVSLVDLGESDIDEDASDKQDTVERNNLVAKKNDRRERKKAKEERELQISATEERILQKDVPRTEEEFEKMVRSSPNSSFVWVQYMAFMESLADVKKARSIAERALRTINFREENEKLNIWTAYFNLENQYGTPPEEAVRKIFQRALQYCDPKRAHLALVGMYERTEQYKLAKDLVERMTKKFKTSCKIWLHRVRSLLKQGKEGIQSVVNRALLSLPRTKHIKFISQTAILEFECGVPDRGRSIFERLLRDYPKRTDLWSVYLDQEIRLGDSEVIRALFERVTCLSLPPRKIEFLFKKYHNYEKSQGDEERIEHVKRKAIEYAESLK